MELTIDKLIYGGDGLARTVAAEGQRSKTVFVPYVLPAERVEAELIEERPAFSRARLAKVLDPSPLRTQPPCPYFGSCGGCHYQHTLYEEQLRLKSEILRETLRRTARIDLQLDIQTHASPPLHYRNRTRFHLRFRPEFAIGYFRHGSHELLPVRECPISSPLINKLLAQLWDEGENNGIPTDIDELEVFASAEDEASMVELYVPPRRGKQHELKDFSKRLANKVPHLAGISVFSNPALRGRGSISAPELLHGQSAIHYRVQDEAYRVSSGAFFQTNRHLTGTMLELAVGQRRGKLALDLYSGVGLFAVPLARRFEGVIAVESSPISSDDLRANVAANVKVSGQSTEAYLSSAVGKLKPELIVVDPPRAGLGSRVCTLIASLDPQEIVYVSCDPATLARDLGQLASAGWSISNMHLIDLFPQTFHIESITVLARIPAKP